MTNSRKARFLRLVDYRDAYTGKSSVERSARRRAVLEAWAYLPSAKDRNTFRKVAGA